MRNKAQSLRTCLVSLPASGNIFSNQQNRSSFSERGPGQTYSMEKPQLFIQRNFFFRPGWCIARQLCQLTPSARQLRYTRKRFQLSVLSIAKFLPGCVTEFECSISAIDRQAF